MTTRSTYLRRLPVSVLVAVLAILASVGTAWAHAVVYPKTSNTGAHERYVLRVPNEKDTATTRVEIHFPSDVKVSSFAEVPGWQLEVQTDSAKHITGAVWTGTLAAHRFVEFAFVATNPKVAMDITWPVYQTYASGEKVEWTGAPGSKSPASVTKISEPSAATQSPWMAWLPWLSLSLSVVAVVVAVTKKR